MISPDILKNVRDYICVLRSLIVATKKTHLFLIGDLQLPLRHLLFGRILRLAELRRPADGLRGDLVFTIYEFGQRFPR